MANSTLKLLQHRMKQRGIQGPISAQAIIICEIMDEYNRLADVAIRLGLPLRRLGGRGWTPGASRFRDRG